MFLVVFGFQLIVWLYVGKTAVVWNGSSDDAVTFRGAHISSGLFHAMDWISRPSLFPDLLQSKFLNFQVLAKVHQGDNEVVDKSFKGKVQRVSEFGLYETDEFRSLLYSYPLKETEEDEPLFNGTHTEAIQRSIYLRRLAHYQLQRNFNHRMYQIVSAPRESNLESLAASALAPETGFFDPNIKP